MCFVVFTYLTFPQVSLSFKAFDGSKAKNITDCGDFIDSNNDP